MNVKLINKAGLEKECPVGFSWTMFLFGFFVPLSRGDLLGVLIHFLPSVFSFGIFWLIWPFFYNKNYINRLLDKGYMPCSASDLSVLKDIGINVSNTFNGNRVSNTCETTPQKSEKVEEVKSPTIAESTPDKPVIRVADENLLGSFDFSNVVSFSWPVALESGSLMKTAGGAGTENLSCSFSFRNMQQRDILYTQWQLKCFDILKKPILTEVPVMVKYEYRVEPKGIVELKSSGKLPEGTKSFVPYLDAVLYEDQTVEDFSKDETLLTLKPRIGIEEVDNFDESGLEEYQRIHSLSQAPKFLYEEGQPVVWTCAFCGTRNLNDTAKCRLCNTPIREDEYCTKDKLEQYFVVYKAQQEKIAEEKRGLLEEEAKAKAEREKKARIEREEKERIDRLEQEERERIAKIKQKKRNALLLKLFIVFLVLGVSAALVWNIMLKPMRGYRIAQEYYETGAYHPAYMAFTRLGDYKDAKEQSLEAYADYLKTEPAKKFRIEGYQLLLTSGYSLERMYALAEEMIELSQFLEGYRIFSLLGDYKDAKEQSLEAYSDYLETESAEDFRVEGYQWLLDNSFPKEDVFASFSRVLEGSKDFDTRLIGYRWLDINGYENAKERMYVLAGEMLSNGRYLDAHGVYSSLGDYKDARNNAAGLTRKVTFDSNGGSFVAPITNFVPNLRIIKPANPSKDGYNFKAWYKDPELTILWDYEEDKVASDMTLYAKWRNYIIGDLGPAGGYIFYDKGSYSNGWRYLEAAPSDILLGASDYEHIFGYYRTTLKGSSVLVGTETGIGSGKSNTEALVTKMGAAAYISDGTWKTTREEYAASLCDMYEAGGYADWFLPSYAELNLMYQNLHSNNLAGFSGGSYWSSSESIADYAWAQNFGNGNQNNNNRSDAYRVRAVRAF